MSQNAKKEAFSRAKTSSRLIVLTGGQRNSFWSSQSQEIDLPRPKRGSHMGFARFLLQTHQRQGERKPRFRFLMDLATKSTFRYFSLVFHTEGTT